METRPLCHIRVERHLGTKWDQFSLKVVAMSEEPWRRTGALPCPIVYESGILQGIKSEADRKSGLAQDGPSSVKDFAICTFNHSVRGVHPRGATLV